MRRTLTLGIGIVLGAGLMMLHGRWGGAARAPAAGTDGVTRSPAPQPAAALSRRTIETGSARTAAEKPADSSPKAPAATATKRTGTGAQPAAPDVSPAGLRTRVPIDDLPGRLAGRVGAAFDNISELAGKLEPGVHIPEDPRLSAAEAERVLDEFDAAFRRVDAAEDDYCRRLPRSASIRRLAVDRRRGRGCVARRLR